MNFDVRLSISEVKISMKNTGQSWVNSFVQMVYCVDRIIENYTK